MSKFNHLVNDFKSGEFSDRMSARSDVDEYKSSAKEILNCFPMKQGGLNKRSGARHFQTLTPTDSVRTIPFIFSKTEAYHISIDPSKLSGTPRPDPNSFDPFQAAPTDTYFPLRADDFITIHRNSDFFAGALGISATVEGELGYAYRDLSDRSGSSDPDNVIYYQPFLFSQYNLINCDPYGFHYAQSADVMVLTHNSGTIPPLLILRTESDKFIVSWYYRYENKAYYGLPSTTDYFSSILKMPLRAPNLTSTTIAGTYDETHRIVVEVPIGGGGLDQSDPTIGQVNLYDVYTLQANSANFFAGKIGSTIAIDVVQGVDVETLDFTIVATPVNQRFATAITSRIQATDHNPTSPYSSNPSSAAQSFVATDNWREGAFSDQYGYPKSVCFFEQRLIFGGTLKDVDTIFGSRTGNILVMLNKKFVQDQGGTDETGLNNFIPSFIPEKDKVIDIFGAVNLETDPISFKPSSQEINSLQFLSSGDALFNGTLGAEYVVSGGQKALSATSIAYRRQTSRGSSPIMPVRIDDETLYILRDGRAVYNFKFNESNGSYQSNELSLHADHIVDYGMGEEVSQFRLAEMCSTRNIALFITTDNKLVGFCYSPANGLMAWHRYDFNEDKVFSACSLPSAAGDVDDIYVTLERNGVVTIERIGIDFLGESLNGQVTPIFLDGSVAYKDITTSRVEDFSYLPDNLKIYIDGQYSSDVVDKSAVTIPVCNHFVIGIDYDSRIITNDLNVGGDFGSSFGLTQRIDRVHAMLYRSASVYMGHRDGKIDKIKSLNTQIETGNFPLDFPKSPSEDGAIVQIESRGAFPMTVLGVIARGQTNDR